MTQQIDEKVCPLCGIKNNCMAHSDQSCWCATIKVPVEMLDLVPADRKRKACICKTCVEAFKKDPEAYKKSMIETAFPRMDRTTNLID